ncbi:hypothetical protein [Streptomyces sp. NPDC001292]|uniref:hypothetical protein n=1 Tax=Streptomyces sp. NPDC001292 TaxID=3364558 RepID=UPI0036C2FAD4
MSWDPQHSNRTFGASDPNGMYAGNGAYQDSGDTHGLQVMRDPYGDGAQAYDGYADPAAAHGWDESVASGHGVPGDAYAHPQGSYGDSHDTYRGGHDAHEGGHGTHETDHGASGTEHEHMDRDDGYASGADEDQNDDGSVFVDVSGRRSRLIRRAGLAVAAVCVVFMAAVIAGFFSSVPSGGPLPWGRDQKQDQKQDPKQDRKQDGSTRATDQPGSTAEPTAEPTADPSATSGKPSEESAAPSPSVSASRAGGETKEPTTKAPTTAAAPTANAPGRGNSSTPPGRGQGSTKGPR